MKKKEINKLAFSSFRDPAGFVFLYKGTLYRCITEKGRADYGLFMKSGLCTELFLSKLLIPHSEEPSSFKIPSQIMRILPDLKPYKILQPEPVSFLSYSHEWCFSQLKDAALLTLGIEKLAIEHGMSLKDASTTNVQFHNSRAIFIDTLSFEAYDPVKPWVAYRQFCMHFLAPLALMSYIGPELGGMPSLYPDGIPLEIASSLLPVRSSLAPGVLMHIHLHARAQEKLSKSAGTGKKGESSKHKTLALIQSLENAVRMLKLKKRSSQWSGYYKLDHVPVLYTDHKSAALRSMLMKIKPKRLWDLGAHTGKFSLCAEELQIPVVSIDSDPHLVEKNYLRNRGKNIFPLVLDLSQSCRPSGSFKRDRNSLINRGPVDCALALALMHHLVITHNIHFTLLAEFFSAICTHLIIEYIPKADRQIQEMLSLREDVFQYYTQENFEKVFGMFFIIKDVVPLDASSRILYRMKVKR